MTIKNKDTSMYEGKTLSHFEDLYGNRRSDLLLMEGLVIVFFRWKQNYIRARLARP